MAAGDGDVAAEAGVPFEYGRKSDGLVQGRPRMFALRGIDEAIIRATPRERIDEEELAQVNMAALQRSLRANGVYLEDVPAASTQAKAGES